MKGTMKALVYQGPGTVQVEERQIPSPGENEVLVKIRAVSVCGSDLGAYKLPEVSDRWQPPLVFGHEFSGTVAELGKGVTSLTVGQRVTANPILYCGECYYCKNGMTNYCTHRHNLGTSIGGKSNDGAMEEYMTIRASSLLPLDERVTFEQGALLEPLAVTYHAAKMGSFGEGERVFVSGLGPIGLMVVKYLKAFGAGKIFASDIVKEKIDKAIEYGADAAFDAREDFTEKVLELTNGVGVDRVILSADAPGVVESALKIIRSGGNIVFLALMHHDISFDPMQIVGRAVNFLGSYMFTDEIKTAMQMLAENKINVDDLITSKYPLEKGPEVFEMLASPDSKDIKVLLMMGE